MARISSTNIAFIPTEGSDEIKSWKKARQEYISNLGRILIKFNESEIIQTFDNWEHSIIELESIDKNQNYMTVLLLISILHHFNRSYDQIKEHIPFTVKMLQHKSRTLNKVSSLVFKYLAIELTDNIEFLRDLTINYVLSWIESPQNRYAGMLILNVAGKFYFSTILLPNVFSITSSKFEILWNSAISDDLTMRIASFKCIDAHFRGLSLISNKKEREDTVLTIFTNCMNQFKLHQPSNHGPVLICGSIFKNSLFHLIDVPSLITSLLEEVNVKSDLLVFSSFSLLLEILKKMPQLFTNEIIHSIFTKLVSSCSRFSSNSCLYQLMNDFIVNSNPSMIPVNVLIEFLKAAMKSPKYKLQQQIGFSILKTLFAIFKDVSVPASIFLDAEPSLQYLEALRMRIPLLNDMRSTLYKYFSEGLGPKVTKNQALLSLYILKTFGHLLFADREAMFTQIRDLIASRYEEVRALVAEVLPLFQCQAALEELLVLALFDDSKVVRLSATKQLRFPERIAHNDAFTQILDDPSLKVQRAAIPIVAKVAPLNPLLFVGQISCFVEKSIRFISSSSDPRECARLSSLFPLIAEHFIPFCEAHVPQIVKLCALFLRQRNNKDEKNNENDVSDEVLIDDIPTADLSHDNFPLISNKPRFNKDCTNMHRIFKIESQEWIDIRDSNLLLTIQRLAAYLSPYINEIVQIFVNIFSITNSSEFVISSALDALIEIVQKLPAASDIPKTHQNLILELMTLLRKQSLVLNSNTTTTEAIEAAVKAAMNMSQATTTTAIDDSNVFSSSDSLSSLSYQVVDTASSFQLSSNLSFNSAEKHNHSAFDFSNSRKILSSNSSAYFSHNFYSRVSRVASIAVKILILMGELGVNSFPRNLAEKSTESDPLSEFNFKSLSFYTDFTISELLKLLKEPNSSIYDVITAIFVKESDTASKFLGPIVDSFSDSIGISKGVQKEILFNQLEIICYYAAEKMTPFVNTILPHIFKNINNVQAINVLIILSYFLKTEFIPMIQPLFQIALHFFHKLFLPKLLPVMSKPQLVSKSSSKSHFSLMNLKSLLSPSTSAPSKSNLNSSNENSNSSSISTSFSSTKYQIPTITNDSINYIESLVKFLTAAVIFQNQPIGLFVSECEQAISHILPKNNLPLSSSSMERLLIILNSLIMIVQLGDASFECANITRICIRLLRTPLKNQVFQLLFSLSIYCHLSPDVIDFLASEENLSNPSIQILRDYLKGQAIPLDTFLVKLSFNVNVKIPDYVALLSMKPRQSIRILQHQSSHRKSSNDDDSSTASDSFPKSSSTFSMTGQTLTNSSLQTSGVETSKSYSNLSYSYVFKDFPPPQFRNIEKWLEDLCNAVVADSPSIAIRSCSKIVQHSPSFKRVIFPIAFLSCWRITQMNDRHEFSNAIQKVLENENSVNPVFLKLAELLLRVGHPFFISNFILAKACQSPAMALRFLVRHLKANPTDYEAIELILTLNMRLGRIDSSAGILKTTKLPTAGTWYEKISDWSSALRFYMKKHLQNHHNHHIHFENELIEFKPSDDNNFDYCTTNCNFSTNEVGPILRCFANLEQWEEIRKLSRLFEAMNDEEKKENAVWYAWSFYKIKDLYKVYSYVKNIQDIENLNTMLFNEIYLVASDQTEKAKALLYKIMQILIRDCSIYSELNASQVDENLAYANYMVEIQEVLEYKNLKAKVMNGYDENDLIVSTNEMVKRWRRRLEYHNGDTLSWLRLVEIRNLAIRTNENQKTYLKLMSVLLKKRKFEIISAFRNEMLQVMHEPSVQILYHKIQWELGKKRQAINSLHLLNLLYDSDRLTIDDFRAEFEKVPWFVKDQFYNDIIKPISQDGLMNSNNEDSAFICFFNFSEVLRSKAKITQKEKGRFYRIEGAFRSQLYRKNETVSNLIKTIQLFEKACSLTPEDYRNWAGLAYSASRAIATNGSNLNDDFVLQAMHGFLKAIQLHQTNNLVFLLQLFSLFFRYGGKVTALGIPDEIVNLGPEVIIQILPQIVCQINHSEKSVRDVAHEILVRFGEKHFQALVFSLHVLITSEDGAKSSIAKELLEDLSLKHAQLANEAQALVDGLLRAAVTWYEMWMTKLDAAYIESSKHNNYSTGIDLLKALFSTVKYPKCRMDRQFIETTKTPISTCQTAINQFMPVEASFHNLWYQLKRLYHFLREKFKQIESIELENVSDELASKRDFLLSIPGTYKVASGDDKNERIYKIKQTLPILTTQQHPRLLFMIDRSGKEWKFLLKGHEDLRLDQRIMQFFNLINTLITSHKAMSDLNVTILKYPIIPFAQNAGLISWVIGADTLHQLVMDFRKSRMMRPWVENDWINMFSIPQGFDLLSSLQKIEIWNSVSAMFPANELYETFWEKTPDAVSYIQCVDTFALTTALMSMAGYIIGLGDRHPSNILIQRQTGHVIHIDFGDSFEIALTRDKMPEKVPFRLTRMLINAFGVSGYEGTFRNACVKIMHVLRENKSSIIAQLEIFVHEPIFQNKDNDNSSEGKNQVLDRIIEKLNGKDPVQKNTVMANSRPISNSPSRRNSTNENRDSSFSMASDDDQSVDDDANESAVIDEEENSNEIDNDELSVEEQVDRLIKIASDPYRYVLHYIGWCQFW